jgi:multiple sugar transport system permease protein
MMVAFGLLPAVFGLKDSFEVTSTSPFGPAESHFSLTHNYASVLQDYRLPIAMKGVGLYLLIWLPLMLVVIFGLALVMDAKRTRFGALTRFIAFVPGAVTGSAAALLWLFMFSPSASPIAPLLRHFAGGDQFVTTERMPVVLAIMATAAGAGGWIVVVYGALVALPPDVMEAADLDGASQWQLVRHVKLPMLRPYVVFIVIVSVAAGLQVFAEPQVIAQGSGGRISKTWSVNQLVYTYATTESNFGKASALSMLLLGACLVIAIVILVKTSFYSLGRDA